MFYLLGIEMTFKTARRVHAGKALGMQLLHPELGF